MSTAVTEQPTRSGQPSVSALVPRPQPGDGPRHRGRLHIAPAVVERVAQGAARKVPGVLLVPRRVGADRLPVQARVLGQVASIRLELAVAYPSPVRETCRRVRRSVVDEVRRTTGVEVTRLDLEVAALQHKPGRSRRVR